MKSRKQKTCPSKPRRSKGFTIIELLVVIAIIAILSSITMALVSNSKMRGRDTRRMTDLNEVQKALNLYFAGSGTFPIFAELTTLTGTDGFSETLEEAELINQVPTDPAHPEYVFTYQSNSSGTDYTITFCLETDIINGYSQGCGNELTP